jgi:hypothetical protein
MTHFCCDAARYIIYIKRAIRRALSTENVIIIHYLFFSTFFFFYREKNSGRRLFPIAVQQVKYNAAVFYYLFIFPLHSHIERVTQRYTTQPIIVKWEKEENKNVFLVFFQEILFRFHFLILFLCRVKFDSVQCCTAAMEWYDMTSPSKYEFVYNMTAAAYYLLGRNESKQETRRAIQKSNQPRIYVILDIWW